MFDFLYNNIPVFLFVGIFFYVVLWILCNCFYKLQKSDIFNPLNSAVPGLLEPMLSHTPNYGNIKFRGFGGLAIYLIFGIIDFFIDISWMNFIFSLLILIGAFNSFTLITELNKALNTKEKIESGRFLKYAYIMLLIYRIVLYVAYILVF